MDREFAFGGFYVDETHCPLSQFALNRKDYSPNPTEALMRVVDIYDGLLRVREETEDYRGVVPEDLAKKCWNEAIEQASDEGYDVEQAESVAKELGWKKVLVEA